LGHVTSIVVGAPEDPHAAAVADAIGAIGGRAVLIDAESLGSKDFVVGDHGVSLFDDAGRPLRPRPERGWLRRLAPEGWQQAVRPDAHGGVTRDAWISAMVSLTELAGLEWLSELPNILAAEDKLIQLRACRELDLPSPPAVLLTRPHRIPAEFGDDLIVKPFAGGHYREDDGTAKVVYATVLRRDDPRLDLLAGAPFLVQPHLQAAAHRRIVTVRERAWVHDLPGEGIAVDWRSTERAHSSFSLVDEPEMAERAIRLSGRLGVGYSSQDWLVDQAGESHFLDLNPAGQWLFLPAAEAVTEAIATWLVGDAAD
jgi:hypothetical protein